MGMTIRVFLQSGGKKLQFESEGGNRRSRSEGVRGNRDGTTHIMQLELAFPGRLPVEGKGEKTPEKISGK